jgi:hypothetical protein
MSRTRVLALAALVLVPACFAMRRPAGEGDRPPDIPRPAYANNRLAEEVRAVLYGAEEIVVVSLEPVGIGDWRVLGQTPVTGWLLRRRVLLAVEGGIAESDGSVAACFRPRHALRASYRGHTAELILCFECNQVKARLDGKERQTVLTARSTQAVLDEVLKDAGVPLAAKPGGK